MHRVPRHEARKRDAGRGRARDDRGLGAGQGAQARGPLDDRRVRRHCRVPAARGHQAQQVVL